MQAPRDERKRGLRHGSGRLVVAPVQFAASYAALCLPTR
jgi:hypothetical protein